MEFPCKIDSLLRDRCFLFQGVQAKIFHGAGQVVGQGFQQGAKRRCRSDLGVEEQVHFAHQLFVQADRNVDCSFEAGPGTKQLPAHRIRLKRYDAQARFGDDCPAMADAFVDALLGIHEGLGHALSRQHQVVLIVLIRPANRNAIGPGNTSDTFDETLGQFVERGRICDQSSHFVQAFEALLLLLKLAGFFGYLVFQIAIHGLQIVGHAIEARGQHAEFVTACMVYARVKISLLYFFNGQLELAHRFKNENVAGIDQQCRDQNRHGHHGHLQQIQQRRPQCHMRFNADDQRVDVGDESACFCAQLIELGLFAFQPAGAEFRPVARDSLEFLTDDIVPGNEERSIGVAQAQDGQALIELGDLLGQLARLPGANGQGQTVCLHPHAPCLVDCRCATVELPGDPQGRGCRAQHKYQEGRHHQG